MSITKFKVGGKEFVIVPRREYERVTARLAAEDRDIAKAHKAMQKLRDGTLKTIPHEKVRRILGL